MKKKSLVFLIHLALAVLCFTPLGAESVSETVESNVLEYRPGDPMPTIRCSLLRHCIITFTPSFELREYVVSDDVRWIIQNGVYGTPEAYYIAIRPRYCGIATLLTIPTNVEMTDVLLRSPECESLEDAHYGDRLRVLDGGLTKSLPDLGKVAEVPQEAPPEVILPVPVKARDVVFARPTRRLRSRGIVVYTDGKKTFVQFPGVPDELPSIARRGKRGKPEVALNPRFKGRILEVDEVISRGFLVFESGKRVPFRIDGYN